MKICDLTQFYSPVGGGVKRYVAEKVRHVQERTSGDEHVLIVPGDRDRRVEAERSRTYLIKSPLVSRTSRYRMIVRLGAIERVLLREKPDLIECGDPYQVAWKAVLSGRALEIPVVGFYHSHFPEAYVRTAQKFFGQTVTELFLDVSRRYIRALYTRFERTIVPSPALGQVLAAWGVDNVTHSDLGVDTAVFRPAPQPDENIRAELGIAPARILLLYVGRLAQEKNTHTLFAAFEALARAHPERFHLVVVGDGLQRQELNALRSRLTHVTHLAFCTEAARLAALYRTADLFVHPGVQETFGLVTLEAQACGTPVIGIRGSYMDRIIQSDQTLWARENSPDALASAIDAASREDLKSSGARVSQLIAGQYSWAHVFTRLFAQYREVIANYPRAR